MHFPDLILRDRHNCMANFFDIHLFTIKAIIPGQAHCLAASIIKNLGAIQNKHLTILMYIIVYTFIEKLQLGYLDNLHASILLNLDLNNLNHISMT